MSRRIGLAACVPIALMLAVAPAMGQDWPMFHCDLALSGASPSQAPDDNTLLWVYPTGYAIEASPVIVGGIVYIGNVAGQFLALDGFDGSLIWTYHAGGPIYSTAAVEYGNVYFLSADGVMHALDAATGVPVWTKPGFGGPWSWSSPSIHNGNLFFAASSGSMVCLDAMSGATTWMQYIGGSPDGPIAIVNGKVYSGTHNFDNLSPTLVALDETTGAILWTYDYFMYHGGVTGMINSNGVAVVDTDNNGVCEIYFGVFNWNGVGNQAVCLSEVDGSEIWTANIHGNSTSTPAVHGGMVFIGSDDANVYALDALTGAQVWNYTTGGQVWAAPVVADGKVFAGSTDHTIYALNENDGSLIWSYFTGASRLLGSPAVADGILYSGNENGKVYAFGSPVYVTLDIKPTSCPNPLNVVSKGVLPVAIVGNETFDVNDVDPATVLLEGVPPKRWAYEDVTTPFEGDLCDCTTMGADGYDDMTLKFMKQSIVEAIGPVDNREDVVLTLTGMLYDGTPFEAQDCVSIRAGGLGGPDREADDPGETIGIFPVTDASEPVQRITYTIPGAASVRLTVFTVTGRVVADLVSGMEAAGTHTVEWDATDQPNGIYFYRLVAGRETVTHKTLLVK